MVRFALAALLITLTAAPALAGPDEDDVVEIDAEDTPEFHAEESTPRVIYKSRTEIDMGELRVDSVIKKPLGDSVYGRRALTFDPLIRLKADFNLEMVDSVHQIR
jgi:hypothetical protein